MSDVIILDHLKEPTEEQFKKFIIGECRRMDRLDVYEWLANDELKIKQLQQENQTLKDKLKQLEKCYCNRSDCSGRIKDSRKYDSVVQQLDKYKEVIEEVREYVNTKLIDVNLTYGIDNEFREEYDDLLQILDKAKENK